MSSEDTITNAGGNGNDANVPAPVSLEPHPGVDGSTTRSGPMPQQQHLNYQQPYTMNRSGRSEYYGGGFVQGDGGPQQPYQQHGYYNSNYNRGAGGGRGRGRGRGGRGRDQGRGNMQYGSSSTGGQTPPFQQQQPQLRQPHQTPTCYNCGCVGHIARDCVNERAPDGGQSRDDITKAKSQYRRCFNCGRMGHISADCTLPAGNKACYRCGLEGHIAKECPNPPQDES